MIKLNTIGVIAAMQIEIDALKERLENSETVTYSGIDYVCGELHGKKVIAAKCGIGKVFAAVCAQTMILKFSPDCIINTGVAGALNRELHICDIVIGEKTVQHDMDTSAIGDPVGLVSGINVVFFESDKNVCDVIEKSAAELQYPHVRGTVACGDRFVSDNETKARIVENFGADACDMESCAMAQVCYINNVPFAAIRAISDGADDGAKMDYPTFARIAAEKGIALTDKFISLA
ncbi:MAG: 5'-methylthioadenosine/adenosylhomocysteine nucleosidase [Clostridia bacterium]|nr:5'-methylthioadenosine/adenosylhomocysteine nucleosidase [Clostridia bacterium]